MFDTLPTASLTSMLSHFVFPMLVAERRNPDAEFRIVATNAALDGISRSGAITGETLASVFPSSVVDMVLRAFAAGKIPSEPQQFSSVKCHCLGKNPLDLALQYLRREDGHDRVIATVQQSREVDTYLNDLIAFEDIRYYALLADLQLENLNSAFTCATEQFQSAAIDEDRIIRLHAVCRTVQRTVADIKSAVKQAQERRTIDITTVHDRTPSCQSNAQACADSRMFDALAGKEPIGATDKRH